MPPLPVPSCVFADAPCLIALAAAISAGVGGVEEKADLTAARRRVDLLCAQDKMPCPRFQAQAVEKRFFKSALDASGKVIDQFDLVGLERAAKHAGKLALGLRLGQLLAE